MGRDSPTEASPAGGAVFVSYASQDAAAAKRICEGLRSGGIEVWFDESELRGGDAWDQKIRRELHDCVLFIPVISGNTAARHEGYFRLEWDLADQRTHMIAHNRAFIVPVCVDGVSETSADTPDSFRRVQWTRLPAGETPAAFVARVKRLVSGEASVTIRASAPSKRQAAPSSWSRLVLSAAAAVSIAIAAAYLAVHRPWLPKEMPAAPAPVSATPVAFNPPPHSIAVLPFVNMSGDKEQDYFSDGLAEELLNDLARINELQVAARTSAFSFRGKDTDVGAIGRRLNVGAVLEGSVRRSGKTIRITAQLNNAVTGFHIWSQTYDRRLGDLLQLQTEIAAAVANALKVTLLADAAGTIGLGATTDPAAFDAYLRGRTIAREAYSADRDQAAISAFTEAIGRDPHYSQAYAERSVAFSTYAEWDASGPEIHEWYVKALADAHKAVALAPRLAEGHYALAIVLREGFLDFSGANTEYERARDLAPGSARMLAAYCRNAAEMGNTAAAIDAARRAILLDPLNFTVHRTVGIAFLMARQYADAIAAFEKALALHPGDTRLYALIGGSRYEMGDLQAARASCEMASADEVGQYCLALTYHRMGMRPEAEAILQKIESTRGDSRAYDVAAIYAQWGDVPNALNSLEAALRLRDPGLSNLKTDPDLDPLRKEPRFQAIVSALKFPE